ncbi:MAG: tRNA (adenosine(37)-N6)-threonylcarbamoyltransferase complex transferase subunit TsaD [Oscillospiraceae bacterium]
MKILSIESSCDETAAAVVEDGRIVLSNIVATQIEEHKLYGGVVPEIASRRHCESVCAVTRQALADANLTLEEIDAIATTYAPGLIGALLVGVNFAKGLALATSKPLIPVHHIRGHIAANYISSLELKPPFLCLVISGGHSHIIEVLTHTEFKVIGRTRDDAVGEAYDKAARSMGFSYPGGIYVDKAAQSGDATKYKLPTPKVDGSKYDFSFSGLKTAVMNLINNSKQKGEEVNVNDLAATFQNTVVDMLSEKLMMAAQEFGYTKIVVAGGVSANSQVRQRLLQECNQRGYTLFIPPLKYCGDNAAMIGSQAYFEACAGNFAGMDLNATASLSIDQNAY